MSPGSMTIAETGPSSGKVDPWLAHRVHFPRSRVRIAALNRNDALYIGPATAANTPSRTRESTLSGKYQVADQAHPHQQEGDRSQQGGQERTPHGHPRHARGN